MKLHIERRTTLSDITSLSGVVCWQGLIYLIGDDSTTLYKLKDNLEIHTRVTLFGEQDQRLAKKDKSDLEAMSFLSINGYPHLLLMGSGSVTPQRDVAFLVKLPTAYNRKHLVWRISLVEFYRLLRSNEMITTNELNIEGLSVGPRFTWLANRGNQSGAQNTALLFDSLEFIEFIQGHTEGVPFPQVLPLELPFINNAPAYFTGLDEYDQQLFFTASAEDSPNAYEDGKVSGSMIGVLELKENMDRTRSKKITLKDYASLPEEGLKIESLSVFEGEKGKYRALAVTDSDGGPSELLLLEIDTSI